MSIKDSHSRKVSFDTGEELGDKIDKLVVMIGKLATRDSRSGRPFKPQIYQGKGRGQNRGNYDRCNYGQQGHQNRYYQIVETGDSIGKTEADPGMHKIIREEILEVMWGCIKILKDKTVEESIEIITEMKVMAEVEIGTGLEKGHFIETLLVIETTAVQATVGPGQDQGQVQIETG